MIGIKYCHDAEIVGIEKIAESVFIFELFHKEISEQARAGMFVNIKVNGFTLRRPFAFMDTNPQKSTFKILFSVVGAGTKEMSLLKIGNSVSVMGVLGNTFPMPNSEYEPVLIAGGSGIPPIHFLAKTFYNSGISSNVIIGAKNISGLFLKDALHSISNLHLSTDDGSEGFHGNSVDLLRNILYSTKIKKPFIYACGPTAMLRALKIFMQERGIDGVFSFESIMGCGFGVCQGCALEKSGVEDTKKEYVLCCSDGPLFDFDEIQI